MTTRQSQYCTSFIKECHLPLPVKQNKFTMAPCHNKVLLFAPRTSRLQKLVKGHQPLSFLSLKQTNPQTSDTIIAKHDKCVSWSHPKCLITHKEIKKIPWRKIWTLFFIPEKGVQTVQVESGVRIASSQPHAKQLSRWRLDATKLNKNSTVYLSPKSQSFTENKHTYTGH